MDFVGLMFLVNGWIDLGFEVWCFGVDLFVGSFGALFDFGDLVFNLGHVDLMFVCGVSWCKQVCVVVNLDNFVFGWVTWVLEIWVLVLSWF